MYLDGGAVGALEHVEAAIRQVYLDQRPVHRRPHAGTVDGQQPFQTARQSDRRSLTIRPVARGGGGGRWRETAEGENVADGVEARPASGGDSGRRRSWTSTGTTGYRALQRLPLDLHTNNRPASLHDRYKHWLF